MSLGTVRFRRTCTCRTNQQIQKARRLKYRGPTILELPYDLIRLEINVLIMQHVRIPLLNIYNVTGVECIAENEFSLYAPGAMTAIVLF